MRRTFALVTGAVLLMAGCSNADDEAGGEQGSSSSAAASSTAPPAEVSLSVEDGTTDLPPTTALEISVTAGELADVELVTGDGTEVDGAVDDAAEGASSGWGPADPLAYGTDYTLTATATNAADQEADAKASFTTVTPDSVQTPSIGPLDGTTVGVGMPIRVFFEQPVTDKAAVERHLKVTSTEETDGSWMWVSDTAVLFRPCH